MILCIYLRSTNDISNALPFMNTSKIVSLYIAMPTAIL